MKVLVINGSPRMEKGNTALVLDPFLEGMREAGADVELFYTSKLKISSCVGDFICWNKTPGKCFIQDNMQMLYPKLRNANILVLATPVYIPLPADMQNFINRIVPLMDPILEMRKRHTRVKMRGDIKISKIVLVATSGWWEKGNFGTVLRIVKELAEDASVEFAGAVLRPHASYLREDNEKTKKVIKAVKQAGYELVKDGRMSPNVLRAISRPLISLDAFLSN